jgi:hypothetical protein
MAQCRRVNKITYCEFYLRIYEFNEFTNHNALVKIRKFVKFANS